MVHHQVMFVTGVTSVKHPCVGFVCVSILGDQQSGRKVSHLSQMSHGDVFEMCVSLLA